MEDPVLGALPFCQVCQSPGPMRQLAVGQDGAATFGCTGCGKTYVQHRCPATWQQWLLPVLATGVSQACPTCGVVYRVSVAIAASPAAPKWAKELAPIAAVAALTVGIVLMARSAVAVPASA